MTDLAIGLMSGTSMDGIDAALIESDGREVVKPLAFDSHPYDADFRKRLAAIMGGRHGEDIQAVEAELTQRHVEAVQSLLRKAGRRADEIAVVGFHGQTILHEPAAGRTWQIGDGPALAEALGIATVYDFRTADVDAGGQGAPLAPAFHAALAKGQGLPVAFLNLGGVGNVTWIGPKGELLAFDTGPANGLIDDWVLSNKGEAWDEGGRYAAAGNVDEAALRRLLDNDYFQQAVPKSLDRYDFDPSSVQGLSLEDGAATLTAFTVESVRQAMMHLPQVPRHWYVCGGGRHNGTLMLKLQEALGAAVSPIEALGWNGDAIEAQAFAYLALRSRDGLPLTYPGTTGVHEPLTGGRFVAA